jgi:uncharacterized protein YbjT (DUF2867 family)
MQDFVAIIGASGNVGHALAEGLLSRAIHVRAIARHAEKLQNLSARGAETRIGTVEDRAFLAEAFRGAAAAFVMIPPNYAAPDFLAYQREIAGHLCAAIREAGVARVVSLSSVGAELASGNGPIAGLHVLETELDQVPGLHVVHLRPTYFMENHLSTIGLIKTMGMNGSAMKADLAMPMIATKDIAAAAVEILATPTFTGRRVRYLLGPRDYTMTDVTRILGAAVGRPGLAYMQFPAADTRNALVGMGLSPSVAGAFVEMAEGFNRGLIAAEPRSAANTTPTTMEEFAATVFKTVFGA